MEKVGEFFEVLDTASQHLLGQVKFAAEALPTASCARKDGQARLAFLGRHVFRMVERISDPGRFAVQAKLLSRLSAGCNH